MSKTIHPFLLPAVWLVTLSMTGCSNTDIKKASTITTDTATIQELNTPKQYPTALIKEDSTMAFLKQAAEISPNKNANTPFNTLDYNKVIAYDYDMNENDGIISIITKGKLAPTVKQQKTLTQQQVDQITTVLGANSTYGDTKAYCFDPHLGIVFYKDTAIVAHMSICLECNHLWSSVNIPATEASKIKIGDDYEYPADGFSKSGRQKINDLCRQLNFSHCTDTLKTTFDK